MYPIARMAATCALSSALLMTTTLAGAPAWADITTTGTNSESINTSGDTSDNFLNIGLGGTGSLTINNGSILTLFGDSSFGGFLGVGRNASGDGTVTVSGSGSTILTTGNDSTVSIGRNDTGAMGTVTVENGGLVDTLFLDVGRDGTGTLVVTGSGSRVLATTQNGVDTDSNGNPTSFAGFATVGRHSGSNGTLRIENGGQMRVGPGSTNNTNSVGAGLNIGRNADATGSVTVTGSGSTLSVEQTAAGSEGVYLNVGRAGTGTLTVSDGGGLTLDGGAAEVGINIGRDSGSTGTVTVTGSGSSLSASLTGAGAASEGVYVNVGRHGTGTLTVSNGATVTIDGGTAAADFDAGENEGGRGTIEIKGAGSTVLVTGTSTSSRYKIDVGIGEDGGSGTLLVTDGARLTIHDNGTQEADFIFGEDSGSTGTGTFSGGGTIVEMTAPDSYLGVGDGGGKGTLTISEGAAFSGLDVGVGNRIGSTGTLTVESGASISLSGMDPIDGSDDGGDGPQFRVGAFGTGTLNILSGGTVTIDNSAGGTESGMTIGAGSSGTGTVNISGSGSTLNAGDAIYIGQDFTGADGGTGTLNVTNGGTAQATSIFIGSRGTLKGNGSIVGSVFNKGGMVSAGTSPGTLTINGDYIQTSGTLLTEIASASSFDQLAVSGSASITGGTIAFSFLDGFTPAPGDDFKFIDADGGVTISSGVATSFSGLPEGFGTGEFEQVLIDGGRLSYITTASVQEDSIEAVGQTQTRTTSTVLARSIQGRIRGVGAGFSRMKTATAGSQTGLAGGSMPEGLGFWLDGTYSRVENDRAQESFEGNTYAGLLGTDYRITDDLLVGGAFGLEFGDIELVSARGDLDTQGYSGTLYAAYRLADAVTFSILGGYAGIGNDIREARFGTRVTGEYDSQRLLGGASVGFFRGIDTWEFLADVGFTYAHEWSDPYTASNGSRVTPANSRIGNLQGGLEVAKNFDFATPFLTMSVDHDFITSREVDSVGDRVDTSSLTAGGGVRLPINDWIEGGILTTFQLGRSQEQAYSVNASLRLQF